MKTKKYFIIPLLSLAFLLVVKDSDAQRRGGPYSRHNSSSLLYSIDFGAGYYKPDMGYWADQGQAFDGGIMLQGGVNFKVYDGVLVGLHGGSYADGVSTSSSIGGIARTEDITYRISPVTLSAKYEFTLGNRIDRFRHTGINRLHPYIGAGINYTLITQNFERNFASEEREDVKRAQNGSAITYSGIAGLNYDLTRNLGIGVEMNYYLGAFDQYVESGGVSTVETISLAGPYMSAKIIVKFVKKRWGYRMPKGR